MAAATAAGEAAGLRREHEMSSATPFVAKITFTTNDGTPFSQPASDNIPLLNVFFLYDNSGTAPTWPGGGTCVMAAGPGNGLASDGSGLPSALIAAGAGVSGVTWWPANPDNYPLASFNYALTVSVFSVTLPTPPPSGCENCGDAALSIFSFSEGGGAQGLFLGWNTLSQYTDVGMQIMLNTPGMVVASPALLAELMALGGNPFDFSWVDLSGEDYSSVILSQDYEGNAWWPQPISSDWSYANLTKTSFAENSLSNATFDNAVLDGTDFSNASLVNATFNGATGAGTGFEGTILAGVSFAGTLMTAPLLNQGTMFTGPLGVVDFSNCGNFVQGVDFSNCNLQGIHFDNANLTGAKFIGAQLQGASFDGATLTNADFTGASLQGTQFTNTDVTQVTFSSSPLFSTDATDRTSFSGSKIPGAFNGYNWSYLDLSGTSYDSKPATIDNMNAQSANLSGMDFSNVAFTADDPSSPPTFAGAILAQTSFAYADLEGAVFSSANGEGGGDPDPNNPFTLAAAFTGANLRDAQFDSALMSGVDFSYALLWGSVTFAEATLTDAVFSNAFAPSVQFTGLKDDQLGGAVFTGACLVNASFENTTLQSGAKSSQVFLDSAFLQGADFSGATFSAVNLSGAVIADDAGDIKTAFTTTPPGTPPFAPLSYKATTLTPSQTTSGTFCVDGSDGPCSAAQLAPPNPMPDVWTQPASIGVA